MSLTPPPFGCLCSRVLQVKKRLLVSTILELSYPETFLALAEGLSDCPGPFVTVGSVVNVYKSRYTWYTTHECWVLSNVHFLKWLAGEKRTLPSATKWDSFGI